MSSIKTRHGVMSTRYPQDYITKELINKGEYEWYVVETIRNLVDKKFDNGIILDIGANVGTVALPIAQMFPQLTVHAFEIQPTVIGILEENIALNNLENVVVHPYGLAEKASMTGIREPDYVSAFNIGAFSLNPVVWQNSPESFGQGELIQVELKRLDDIEFNAPIRCIKLDVEGYEQLVLEGAHQTLSNNNYPPLVYELWTYNKWWDEEARKLTGLVQAFGYKIYQIGDTAVAIKQ